MYISSNGNTLLSDESIIKDKLDIYFKLDKFDVPFMSIGISYTFTKSNLYDSIAYLRLLCSNAMEHMKDPKLSLKTINYDRGNFNIIFDYDGKQLTYKLD